MKRRKFLTDLGVALLCCQGSSWATECARPPLARGKKKHFDLSLAMVLKEEFLASEREQRLTTDFPDLNIDLSACSSSSIDALEHLASLNGDFAFLGFDVVSVEMAKVLGEWNTYALIFERISKLCSAAAGCLGSQQRGHLLDFQGPLTLETSAARALARNDAILSLQLQSAPRLSLAQALAGHRHELTLQIPSVIHSPLVAKALSLHSGYCLNILMPSRPSEIVLQQLAANPKKCLRLLSPEKLDESCGMFKHSTTHEHWLVSLDEDIDAWRARAIDAGYDGFIQRYPQA